VNTVPTLLDAEDLYQRYGKALEPTHAGEYVAIAHDGRVIVSPDDVEVVRRAIADFGSGSFAFYRVGSTYVDALR
jgi:hypothetical protein